MDHPPRPPGAGDEALPADLLALTEVLAQHTHDAWARLRRADGWRYGPRRDDARKEHPGLVPYDELSESEKEYDRTTAREVLRALLALGYRIEGPGARAGRGRRGKRR